MCAVCELKVNGDDVVYSIEIEPLCPHDIATTFGGHQWQLQLQPPLPSNSSAGQKLAGVAYKIDN